MLYREVLPFFHVTYHISCTFGGIHGVPSTPEDLITMGTADSGLWGQSLGVRSECVRQTEHRV